MLRMAGITAVCARAKARAARPRIAMAPRGGELSASVLMTAPIWVIRRIDLDTPYRNWTVYHRSHDTFFTWPGFRHVRPRPAAGASRADLDPAPEGKARAPDQGGDRRGRDRPGRHLRTRRSVDPPGSRGAEDPADGPLPLLRPQGRT